MKLIALPAFSDNYIWLLHNDHHALVVDPGDSAPVLSWLAKNPSVALDMILVTHHHADHTGGLPELVAQTGAQVVGPALEKMPVTAQGLQQGDTLEWQGLTLMVHDVPGHTLGHIAFWGQPAGQAPILFCGDTLFSGGCGRLFEGSPEQMLDSLDRLAALPGETRICCAHEYTLSNLRFALVVDPDNLALKSYAQTCVRLREQNQATLPALMSTERAINPFLRSRSPAVTRTVQQRDASAIDDVSRFAALRNWKNEF
ncbi:hydroxyacylglutathione hydrolase [Limnohabitans sp. G3-2]|uniref:hydroxyacylglutathione hydrolase n=1 Tax=Limnohabitans sp. G3-2 TaxID=1100711 RepID=UPI000C1DE100|nr:hydroxyacylglutathione hydrolase [Limnohabitans sp. G3-2]PIT77956.1 hydroxyacylglutathione hydrolase [Limnohabitans sp. G3-2]